MNLQDTALRAIVLGSMMLVPAYATDVTYSAPSGAIPVGGSAVVTLPQFDGTLGVLRNVLVSGLSSVSGTWSVENLSASPNTFGGYASGTYVVAAVFMTWATGALSPMNPAYLIDPLTLPAFDGTADYGGASGTVLAFTNQYGDGGPGQSAPFFTDSAILPFIGTGSLAFTVSLPNNPVPNMPPNFQTSVTVTTDTFVQVRYTYEPFPTRICRGTSFSNCPCGNASLTSSGCGNSSNSNGGTLAVAGTASISNDSLVLFGSTMPNGGALYFEGTSFAYAQTAFGDGMLCIGGSLVRLGVKFNAGGASQYPAAGDPSISSSTGIAAPALRTYQIWYRDSATYCTAATFNITNGYAVQWGA